MTNNQTRGPQTSVSGSSTSPPNNVTHTHKNLKKNKMQIVKLFGAIKKKLSPRHHHHHRSSDDHDDEDNQFYSNSSQKQQQQHRKCHSTSNTPRGGAAGGRRNSSSSSSLHYSSGASDSGGGGDDMMMTIEDLMMETEQIAAAEEEEEEHFFVWDTEKIKANITRKQQYANNMNTNNMNMNNYGNNNGRGSLDNNNLMMMSNSLSPSSVDDANSTNSSHTITSTNNTCDDHHNDKKKRTSRKLFSKYKRSSSVSSGMDQLANSSSSSSKEQAKKKSSATSPRFDFFSKKRRSSGDLDCKRASAGCSSSAVTQPSVSSTSQSEEIDYSEFNLRIPSSRTLKMLLSEPKTISPPSQSSPRTASTSQSPKHQLKEIKPVENIMKSEEKKDTLEPNNSMHQSSSSFDAFFEDYSNTVLDQAPPPPMSNQNSNKPLSSLANSELCSMKSFKRTPSSAKPLINNNQKKNESSCELKTNKNNNGISSTFSSSSSSTSIDLMGEDTLMKYGIVRISFEPLTSNTTATPQPQQSTAELLEKLQQ